MARSSDKVTIKKYANRRLYDTESSSYITLDRLAEMVREGREFEVVDAKTGEDITRQVLTQIIVDEEARGSTMLPVNFLKQLIGLYGNSMQGMVPQYLEAAMDAFQRNQSAFQDAFGGKMFADIAKRNMQMFEGASRASQARRPEPRTSPRNRLPKVKSTSFVPSSPPCAIRSTDCPSDQSRQVNGVEVKRVALFAMVCFLAPGSANAQMTDFSYSPVSPGSWTYRAVAGGSEAAFVDGTGTARMVIACGKVTRLVTISRISAAPAASLSFWTSSATRDLGARFDQRAGRVIAQVGSMDPLLDALAFSRGRFASLMPGSPVLVLPAEPEIAHVVEDCRA